MEISDFMVKKKFDCVFINVFVVWKVLVIVFILISVVLMIVLIVVVMKKLKSDCELVENYKGDYVI